MELSPNWEYVADSVMGGVSQGALRIEEVDGRMAARLIGTVSLDNNGGFVQMAFDTQGIDPAVWTGIELDALGNGERYELRLRTDQLTRPWQSYRAEFQAHDTWSTVRIPFASFAPHRTDLAMELTGLRRIGVLAIGRPFQADVAVSAIRLIK